MAFSPENRANTFNGLLFVALFALAATYIAEFSWLQHLGISPLIVGILLGIFYANTLRNHLPEEWVPGIQFSMKTVLRVAIVFYGFRITFQHISEMGVSGILISMAVVSATFILGYIVGTKILKMDRDITLLISAGSSICGAAAVLATEPVLKSEPYKSAVAVATVVIFGSISMFLYPAMYYMGLIPFDEQVMGMYIGGTLHEVAHVVAAGNAVSEQAAKTAVIVKMTRVMLLAPFLILLGLWLLPKGRGANGKKMMTDITIPWFALFFIAVAGVNSLQIIPSEIVNHINHLDTFALTMAMTAMGMETRLSKLKVVGLKPIYLATFLFLWLVFGGFCIVNGVV